MWKTFSKSNLELCIKEPYQFFLVRKTGKHPVSGEKYTPIVVQLIFNQLYTSDNELEPLIFSHKDDDFDPQTDPFVCGLEWCELPE